MSYYRWTPPESLHIKPQEYEPYAWLIDELHLQDSRQERQEILDDLKLRVGRRFTNAPSWKEWQAELIAKAKELENE